MLPLPYCLRSARRLWHQDFTARCVALPLQVRRRTLRAADGTPTEQVYAVGQKAAPTTCKDTASLLLKMALDAVERARQAPRLETLASRPVGPVAGEPAAAAGAALGVEADPMPPSIFVNAPALGRKRSLSAVTIRAHLRQLQALGFIIARRFHGTRADIELTINPRYLWKQPAPDVEKALHTVFGDTLPGAASPADGTNLSLKALVTLATGESATSDGELLPRPAPPSAPRRGALAPATPSGHTGPQDPPSQRAPEQRPSGQERRSGGARPAATAAPSLAVQRGYVTGFWDYARRRLYAARSFSEEQIRRTLNAIWAGVYAGFPATLSEREWDAYHTEALQRVDLVVEWLGRHPEKYLPAPYAEIVQGCGYFDRANARGFIATEEWLARRVAAQFQHRAEEALRKARVELRNWRQRRGSQKNLRLSYSQLYHTHEKRLLAFGPATLQRYYAQVAGPAGAAA